MQYFSATWYFLVKITKNEYFFQNINKTGTEFIKQLFRCVRAHKDTGSSFSGHSQLLCSLHGLQRSARKHLAIVGVLLFYRRDAVCDSEPA